ncbi:hypothetical protein EV175_003754, partial [Coemansia sp. RSA 1933]
RKSRDTSACLRCRLTETLCDGKEPECSGCTRAKVKCLGFPLIKNDAVFGLPSINHKKTSKGVVKKGLKRTPVIWKQLKCSKEFLTQNPASGRHSPEDLNSIAGDLAGRKRREQRRLMKLLSQPLKQTIEDYPARSVDGKDEGLLLPSSELLCCIGQSIAKSEARKESEVDANEQDIAFSEHMSGSSLLALG